MPTFSKVLDWMQVQSHLRLVFSVLPQVIAGFIALSTLLLVIDLLKAEFSQGTDSSTSLAMLFFAVGFIALAFCLAETSLYRGRAIRQMRDTQYPMLSISAQMSLWAGEVYAALMVGAGLLAVIGSLLSKNAGYGLGAIGGLGESSPQGALRFFVVLATPGLLFLVAAYALAELCGWLVDMAQYNRLQALQAQVSRQQ
jgi:hypothetical protein